MMLLFRILLAAVGSLIAGLGVYGVLYCFGHPGTCVPKIATFITAYWIMEATQDW